MPAHDIVLYEAPDGKLSVRLGAKDGTVWLSLDQISRLFGRDKSVVSRHLRNVFASGELVRERAVAFFATTADDGKTYQVEHFNLDAIISVGYRVNGVRATRFRQWATEILRGYLTDGYAVDRKRVAANHGSFQKALGEIRSLLPRGGLLDADAALELASAFAETWLSLDAYDRGELPVRGATRAQASAAAGELAEALARFAASLRSDGRAGDLFGRERSSGTLAGAVGSVFQSFDGKDLYPTVEEKAAHLLYFVVKGHPFADGNKRSGAYAFIWFLSRCGALDISRLTPAALTALTLLVASSDPKEKDRMVGLTLQLLRASGK